MEVRDDGMRRDFLAARRDDARGATLDHQDFADRALRAYLDAARRAGARHRLGDGAHAADRVAPDALLAGGLAETVVQQHIGGAGGIGTGVGPDNSVEAEDRPERLGFEPCVQQVAGGASENLEKITLPLQPERPQAVRDPHGAENRAKPGEDVASGGRIGRRLHRGGAQCVGHPLEPGFVGVEAFGVADGKFCDLGLRPPGRGLQITAVRQRQEVGERPLDDPEAVSREIEVADDLRIEERHRIGGDRISKAGMEFFRRRRAADDRAPLQNGDLQACSGEIGGRGEPVVASANDDDVQHRAPCASDAHTSNLTPWASGSSAE